MEPLSESPSLQKHARRSLWALVAISFCSLLGMMAVIVQLGNFYRASAFEPQSGAERASVRSRSVAAAHSPALSAVARTPSGRSMAQAPAAGSHLFASVADHWHLQRQPLLDQQLQQLAQQHRLAHAGLMVIDLNSGAYGGYRERQIFESASLMKVPLMMGGMREVSQGRSQLTASVPVVWHNMTATAWFPHDPDPPLRPGRSQPLKQLFKVMISRSDNVATNTLLDVFSRQKINSYLQALGLTQTRIAYKLSGSTQSVPDGGYAGGINQTSAWDMARLLALIYHHKVLDPASCQTMLAWLKTQQDKTKIAAGLPKSVILAHKTGENSRGTHDAAIVETPRHRYVLAMMTPLGAGDPTYQRMAGLSRALYQRIEGDPSLMRENLPDPAAPRRAEAVVARIREQLQP
jgi:beta-lactamase class A